MGLPELTEEFLAKTLYDAIMADDPKIWLHGDWDANWNESRIEAEVGGRQRAIAIDGKIDFRFLAQFLQKAILQKESEDIYTKDRVNTKE